MIVAIILVFLIGYAMIALEHPLRIDKAASALLTGVVMWVLFMFIAEDVVPHLFHGSFGAFLTERPALADESLYTQVIAFVQQVLGIEVLGEVAEILFFLIGAMTVVEMVDIHGGFEIITEKIKTSDKRRLMWIIGTLTFFMSATLDNLTTSIVMAALLGKIIKDQQERWLFAGIVIIAANSGGAWSPIGDVTTIMLWVRGNITAANIIPAIILPSIVSFVIPCFIASRWLKGKLEPMDKVAPAANHHVVPRRLSVTMLIMGVAGLLSVPVFKSVTHLPPYMGILLVLGVMWAYTEFIYRNDGHGAARPRVPFAMRKIDMSTIMFFLGILLAVGALQASGVLAGLSVWLDTEVHNVYTINILVGALSSIVDNVPLVAGSIATYPLADAASIAASADPTYAAAFARDGIFWEFLAYCAGVGGSMLIIGSAAGVVIMGLEKISFGWYLKKISLLALIGYLAGAGVFILQKMIF